MRLPNETDAEQAARAAMGWMGIDRVRRFTTGLAFFVYEVTSGPGAVVVRLGTAAQRQILVDGLFLWNRLRPLDVPLPQILADGTDQPLPYVVMQRLPGRDLGDAIATMTADKRRQVARTIAEVQAKIATLGNAPGYGYAPTADRALHPDWASTVRANLDRSHRRLVEHGLFDPALVAMLRAQFDRLTPAMSRIPATPFLHDTTTKNVIIAPDGTLSGIVDVDDLCFGDPRYAIGLTRAALLSLGQPLDYVQTWLDHSRLADDAVMAFYAPLFLLDFMSEHGANFNGNQPASDPAERQRIEALFLAELDRLA